MSTHLPVTQWAARHGLGKPGGYRAVKRCGIQIVDGLVDVEYADMLYKRHTRARVNPKRAQRMPEPEPDRTAPDGRVVTYDEARRRREIAEAQLAELKLAEAAGRLVARADVVRACFTASRVMRDQLMAASPRLAAAVVDLTDVVAVERTISSEHRAVLNAFATMLRAAVPNAERQSDDAG